MIFQAFHDKVRTDRNPDGQKTMTRRVMDEQDEIKFVGVAQRVNATAFYSSRDYFDAHQIEAVYRNGRCLYRLGQQLTNQPGRGKSANGHTPPITEIRLERVGEITVPDCIFEGLTWSDNGHVRTGSELIQAFALLWNNLHWRASEKWPDAPCYVVNWGQPSGFQRETPGRIERA